MNRLNEMTEFLKELIAVRSVKAPPLPGMPYGENSARVLEIFLNHAKKLGFITRNFDNYVGTIDLCEGEPVLGILCHLDIVPEGTGWSYPPFELTKANGNLYGRGTFDDKGPAVAALYALLNAKEKGITQNVRLIVGCNEETGSDDLAYYKTVEALPDMLFSPDADFPVVTTEKGIIHASFKIPLGDSEIENIEAGTVINAVPSGAVVTLKNGEKFEFTGKNSHASLPWEGDNAITKMLNELKNKLPGEMAVSCLAEKFPHGDLYGKGLAIDAEDEPSGRLTCQLTVMSVENGVLCGKIDIRYPLCTTLEEISEKLENAFPGIEINGNRPHHVDPDSDFVRCLLEAYEEVTGLKGYTIAIGGGTYVHDTKGGVAFGMTMPGNDNHIHSFDEFISEEEFVNGVEIFEKAIEKIVRL